MSKITEYEVASAFDANDVLLKDGENGTMIISVEDAASEFKRLGGIADDISGINQTVTEAMGTMNSNVAGVESDYIASKDYAIGDLFIVNNVLYKATAAIAEEDIIDSDTNCTPVNLGDEIGNIRDILDTKANVDGSYSTLTAGNAEQLVGTVFTEDDTAYTFRTSGGSADIGDREYDEIVGGSIVWNQRSQTNKAQSTVFTSTNFVIENGVARIWGTLGSIGAFRMGDSNIPIPANHVVFVDTGLTDNVLTCHIQGFNTSGRKNNIIIKAATDSVVYDIVIAVYGNIGDEIDITFKPQIFDLTQMFGSEIADYIYGLETATPGAGVAWFRKYFPKDYYEYNAGELMHVSDLQSHDMVGFNAFDKTVQRTDNCYLVNDGSTVSNTSWSVTDYIPIVGGQVYYLNCTLGDSPAFCWYDSSKEFISGIAGRDVTASKLITAPQNAHFLRASIQITDIDTACINLSWDGERDGEYEPYVKHSYPLDSSLTLRGIPKLSTDGKLYYDGDHYKSDGTVERRYGIVDLGTLEWEATTTENRYLAYLAPNPYAKPSGSYNVAVPFVTDSKYAVRSQNQVYSNYVGLSIQSVNGNSLYIYDDTVSTAEALKASLAGKYLVYELAEPTTEEAQPFQSPQIVDDFGTEEYVTSSIVPVGHITQYDSNLRAKLEMAPNSPDGDGDYMVRQTSGQNEYVPYTDGGRITALESKIPAAPSANGSYILKCTVTDGTATYAWVAE